jgi:cyd operon protein YbgT
LGLACAFSILNAMWFELRENTALQNAASSKANADIEV